MYILGVKPSVSYVEELRDLSLLNHFGFENQQNWNTIYYYYLLNRINNINLIYMAYDTYRNCKGLF